MKFREDAPGVDENPLRGFVVYSNAKQTSESFPHSLEWFYLSLADVVKGPDVYDWAAFERQLTAIAGRGHQAVFRFYIDFPKKPTGIPKYLLDKGLRTLPYRDADNATGPSASVAPDYSDPRLKECMIRFIRAFGQRYDGDVRIAYITAGLYGFWGEWHVHNHPLPGESKRWKISQKDKDALLQAYVQSFRRTHIMVRYPKVTGNRRLLSHFGFHDDSFLWDTLGPEKSHFWPGMERSRMTEAWQSHPIGGELYPNLQGDVWDKWPNSDGQDVRTAITTSHITWILDSGLFKSDLTAAERMNALRAERMLGYLLFCSAASMYRTNKGMTIVKVRLENRGVAPFYYSWRAELDALDPGRTQIEKTTVDWQLSSLLPGEEAEWSAHFHTSPEFIKTVLLRVVNPMPGGNPIAFANAEMGSVRPGWLTLRVSTDP